MIDYRPYPAGWALGDPPAAARAAPELPDCVRDGDVPRDQKVETQARDRIRFRSERSSWPKEVQPDVPEGVQSPPRYDPPYRAEQADQPHAAEDRNPTTSATTHKVLSPALRANTT
jgi:hypothetical protein